MAATATAAAAYEWESVIRGHHIYESIWSPVIGKFLCCKHKINSDEDPYATYILKDDTIVGHVIFKTFSFCSLVLLCFPAMPSMPHCTCSI